MTSTKSVYRQNLGGKNYLYEYELVSNEKIEKEIREHIGEPIEKMFLEVFNKYANQETKKTLFEDSPCYKMYYQHAQIKDNPQIGITLNIGEIFGFIPPICKELNILLGYYTNIQTRSSFLDKIFYHQPISLDIINKITKNQGWSLSFLGNKEEWFFQKYNKPCYKQNILELQDKIKNDLEQKSLEIASINKNTHPNKYILNK